MVRHTLKNLAANAARFLKWSDHFGTLCIKGLRKSQSFMNYFLCRQNLRPSSLQRFSLKPPLISHVIFGAKDDDIAHKLFYVDCNFCWKTQLYTLPYIKNHFSQGDALQMICRFY